MSRKMDNQVLLYAGLKVFYSILFLTKKVNKVKIKQAGFAPACIQTIELGFIKTYIYIIIFS